MQTKNLQYKSECSQVLKKAQFKVFSLTQNVEIYTNKIKRTIKAILSDKNLYFNIFNFTGLVVDEYKYLTD